MASIALGYFTNNSGSYAGHNAQEHGTRCLFTHGTRTFFVIRNIPVIFGISYNISSLKRVQCVQNAATFISLPIIKRGFV